MEQILGWLLYVVIVNLIGFGAFAVRRWHGRLDSDQAKWFSAGLDAASRELGIAFAPRSPASRAASGQCGPFSVRLSLTLVFVPSTDEEQISERVEQLRVSLSGGLIPKTVSFGRERGRGDDVLVGDPAFDDVVEARGEPSVVLALLDERVRMQVRTLVGDGGRLENGEIVLETPVQMVSQEIPHALRTLLRLARDLSSTEGGGLLERLARNAVEDRVSAVRLWNLHALQEQFPQAAAAAEASRASLSDSSPWVRLAAARFLRAEGRTALEALAGDPATPDQAAAEAVSLLAARAPADEIGPLLVTILRTRAGETSRHAVEELGRMRHAPALEPLIVLLEQPDPRMAAAAAEALGRLGDPRAEPALVTAAWSEQRELRIPAARALGALGTVQSVEPLLSLLDTRRRDAESRQAIRDCVAAIQSRLAGAEAGQLSLSEDSRETGRLSLATPSPGRGDLSLAEDTDER